VRRRNLEQDDVVSLATLTLEDVFGIGARDVLCHGKVGVDLLERGLAREVPEGRVHDADELRRANA
jgi:hypothetical protein